MRCAQRLVGFNNVESSLGQGGHLVFVEGIHPAEGLQQLENGLLHAGLPRGAGDAEGGFDLGFVYAPLDWLSLGIDVPFLQIQDRTELGDTLVAAYGGSGGTIGLGDLQFQVAFAPLRQRSGHAVSLSIVPRAVFPTGSQAQQGGRRR